MTTSVAVIRDYLDQRTMTLMYTQAQKSALMAVWQATDPLLVALQGQPVFRDKVRLYDLEPFHFRVLLALNIALLGDLSDVDRLDKTNLTMRSLDWVLMGLINCLETRTQSAIAVLNVNRVSKENVLVDVVMNMEPIKMPKPRLSVPRKIRVVVDNERD